MTRLSPQTRQLVNEVLDKQQLELQQQHQRDLQQQQDLFEQRYDGLVAQLQQARAAHYSLAHQYAELGEQLRRSQQAVALLQSYYPHTLPPVPGQEPT